MKNKNDWKYYSLLTIKRAKFCLQRLRDKCVLHVFWSLLDTIHHDTRSILWLWLNLSHSQDSFFLIQFKKSLSRVILRLYLYLENSFPNMVWSGIRKTKTAMPARHDGPISCHSRPITAAAWRGPTHRKCRKIVTWENRCKQNSIKPYYFVIKKRQRKKLNKSLIMINIYYI